MLTASIIDNLKTQIFNPLLGIMLTVALAVFLMGLYKLFISKENEALNAQGVKNIIWGLVGFAIIVSAYGILRFVCVSITACV